MGWAPQAGETVIDRGGTHYELSELIAEGGQGAVFRTQAEGAAVKISTSQSSPEVIEQQIRRVARLPIADLSVALPRQTLQAPTVGYVMTLLTGMVTATTLGRWPRSGSSISRWYEQTGGLRKRLAVVESLAEIIASLHARGLVYGDLNGDNVMVSASPGGDQVFLIDLDNLRASDEPPRIIYQPRFGAPEQATVGATQASDRFSLAVLTFELLAAGNPFYGQVLRELPPEDFAASPYSALAPWVDDPDDPTNRTNTLLDRELVVSPRMHGLFASSFGRGRNELDARPPASLFAAAARSARHACARCAACGWDNYVARTTCASCDRKLGYRVYRLYDTTDGDFRVFDRCPFAVLEDNRELRLSSADVGLAGEVRPRAVTVREGGSVVEVSIDHEHLTLVGRHGARATLPLDQAIGIARRGRSTLLLVPGEVGTR